MALKSKNNVLTRLSELLKENQVNIIQKNQIDMDSISDSDISMIDRLKVDKQKIEGMIKSLNEVSQQKDPEGKVLYEYIREDGLHIINKTVPFGTILIIYESRPDVTIEAAATAFKAGNRIILKGGRESLNTNIALTELWKQALQENGFDSDYVKYLNISRDETQSLIKNSNNKIDLIIPRGGDALINFVIQNSSAPVIISGRGNNFIYIDDECDIKKAIQLIINGKQRISVCNAIDKVLINKNLDRLEDNIAIFINYLKDYNIEVYSNSEVSNISKVVTIDDNPEIMYEEFLAPKIYFSLVDNLTEAVNTINKYSGGHSAVIVTENE